ncbi:regulator of MON1-CCZ1 complex [Plasmodium yoelii yoelii]|uniref:Regulator of MON1-CCZ1 complex n=1 Tax=Plasmodium yoelii yoelii TaxID=73239 RepID=A0AAE9WVU6_PLAYO|nr:regulator of MON1-CCZ1 complex [Plasmodium yoelii yoelii]
MNIDNVIKSEHTGIVNKRDIQEGDNLSKEKKRDEMNLLNKQNKEDKEIRRSKSISTYSPAYISEPIYQWEVSKNDRIFYDKINDFIIHQNVLTKALLVTDIKKTEENYKGVYVKFDKNLCEHICFSANKSFFLYYSTNPNIIEISDILNNHNIYLNVEINKLDECEILSAFWLNDNTLKGLNGNIASSDFVVITNNSIEIFNISFDNLIINPLKKHYIKSKYSWHNENTSYIALLSLTKNNVILPYLLNNNNAIKLPKIELNITQTDNINKNDIEIIILYNETYCIHKDFKNGRISFRCLSSIVYFDYVLDLFASGMVDTFCINNLFGVFNYINEQIYIFDIKYKKQNSITSLNNNTVNISYLTSPKAFKRNINCNYIFFKSPNIIIDAHYGNIYSINIDYDILMLQICQHFSNLSTSVDVLLRRPDCKKRITEMFFLALENYIKIEDFLTIINIININYRKLIEQCAKKGKCSTTITRQKNKIIQPLGEVLKNLDGKTLITEKDIVTEVFHPFIVKKYNLNKKETLFNLSINFLEMKMAKKKNKADKIKTQCRKSGGKSGEKNGEKIGEKSGEKKEDTINEELKQISNFVNIQNSNDNMINSDNSGIIQNNKNESIYHESLNYSELQNSSLFLIYILEYMKSLLYLNIIPNRILQTFIFDVCVFFKQDNFLRQLLQFYVISDSIEVTKRLFHYWQFTKYVWAYQFCLDMSLRLKEYEMVVHLFLSAKKYLKIIKFLRNYNLTDYPISVIFQAIENDLDSPKKYTILNNVLFSLNKWIIDSDKDPVKYPLPNLQVNNFFH